MDNQAEILYNYAKFSHAERVENKTIAKNKATLADWGVLINNYIEANNLAIKKVFGKNN